MSAMKPDTKKDVSARLRSIADHTTVAATEDTSMQNSRTQSNCLSPLPLPE